MEQARQDRRSFLTDLLTRVAGGWVAVASGSAFASLLGGCPSPVVKYGGPPVGPTPVGPTPASGPGGPPPADAGSPAPAADATPPQGPPPRKQRPGALPPPTTKYGGPFTRPPGPTTKYGGPIPSPWGASKYGGPTPAPRITTKYGGPIRP